jgi:hypothetical protein
VSDPAAETEVEGLVPSRPTLRPADILTVAVHETSTVAVDIGIKAPHALDAGLDCTETMKQAKMQYYADCLEELALQNIQYAPATFSSYGRRHSDTSKMTLLAARRAARYRGLPDHRSLLARWRRTLAVEVWRRSAKMLIACLPRDSDEADYLFAGERHAR